MKQIKGYDIPLTGSPARIPDAPIRSVAVPTLGMYAVTAYLEIELGDAGQPAVDSSILVQIIPAEQGIPDGWTWLAAAGDGRSHLFKVADASNAS